MAQPGGLCILRAPLPRALRAPLLRAAAETAKPAATPPSMRRFPTILLLLLLSTPATPVAGQEARNSGQDLTAVRQAIEGGDAAGAIDLLRRRDLTPEARMLRGMARVMLGELRSGGADLEQAVQDDPTLREAWLNLAGLEIAEEDYGQALGLLEKARALDPAAPDVQLNIGAVMLMLGRPEDAREPIARYLELDGSAEARFLVASNYALAGRPTEVVQHLREAIRLDERMRLRARRDGRFAGLDHMDYRVLLHTDLYEPPAGHHKSAAAFTTPYDQQEPRLLYAVLDSLPDIGLSYDPEIESTARWALIWGEKARIKVHTQENGTGVVSMSGPPEATSQGEWQRLTQELFRAVHRRLDRAAPPTLPRSSGSGGLR